MAGIMKKSIRVALFFLGLVLVPLTGVPEGHAQDDELFATLKSKEQFAAEMSSMLEKAWKIWQDSVLINDIDVEGSRGILMPGDMGRPVLAAADITAYFDRSGKSQAYIDCVRAVAKAVENGMRVWQKGYSHDNIPFPQGASCSYTLPPCSNIPVTVDSGISTEERMMTEEELYNFMLYRSPDRGKDLLIVIRGSAKAIAECFKKWKSSCSIIVIVASGGMAPQPAPMGTGPGPVRGAKGYNGKLIGTYIDGALMYNIMVMYFKEQEKAKALPDA